MPDDVFLATADALLLDPPIGVPESAPLDMPRRRIQFLPVDLTRVSSLALLFGRRQQGSEAG